MPSCLRTLATLLIVLLPFAPELAAADAPAPMELLGVRAGEPPAVPATRPAITVSAVQGPIEPWAFVRALGGGIATGMLDALPSFMRALRNDPASVLLRVGAMMAAGAFCPPAAVVLGSVALAHAMLQTRGDVAAIGRVAGDMLFWGMLGGGLRSLVAR